MEIRCFCPESWEPRAPAQGLVAVGERGNELMGIGHLCCVDNLFLGGVRFPVGNILPDGDTK